MIDIDIFFGVQETLQFVPSLGDAFDAYPYGGCTSKSSDLGSKTGMPEQFYSFIITFPNYDLVGGIPTRFNPSEK